MNITISLFSDTYQAFDFLIITTPPPVFKYLSGGVTTRETLGVQEDGAEPGMPTPEEENWRYSEASILSRGRAGKARSAPDQRLRVLLADDDPRSCESLTALLRVVGYDVVGVRSGSEALALLEGRGFDAVIIDVDLPDTGGIRVLRGAKARDGDAGTLMLSAKASFQHAVDSLNQGADAFLLKPANPDDLITLLERVTRLKRLEKGLRASEERYRNLFQNIGDGAFQADLDGAFTDINRAGAEILGYDSPAEVLDCGMKAWELFSSLEEYEALKEKALREGEVRRVLGRYRRRNGSLGWLESTIRARSDASGKVTGLEGIFRDVSDRIRYQEVLEALYSLWADLGDVETVEDAGNLTMEFLREVLGIDRGMFSVIEGEVVKPVREGDRSGDGEYNLRGENIVARAVRTGMAQLVPALEEDSVALAGPGWEGSEIAVPVRMVDGIIGVIHAVRSEPPPFTEDDQKLVEIVSERLALALERIVRSKIGFKAGMSLKDFL